MYRFVIEHPRWISPERLTELDVRAGADRGRIYRIVREDADPPRIPRLDPLKTPDLARVLDSPNGAAPRHCAAVARPSGGCVRPSPILTDLATRECAARRCGCRHSGTLDGLDRRSRTDRRRYGSGPTATPACALRRSGSPRNGSDPVIRRSARQCCGWWTIGSLASRYPTRAQPGRVGLSRAGAGDGPARDRGAPQSSGSSPRRSARPVGNLSSFYSPSSQRSWRSVSTREVGLLEPLLIATFAGSGSDVRGDG